MKAERRPAWLRKKIVFDQEEKTQRLLKTLGLNTVCHEAKCPNISECYRQSHATFLILGKSCTRRCAFCHVEKEAPRDCDEHEPFRVAQAVQRMKLKHAVVTSVTRDDLSDGGASQFARTVKEIKKLCPDTTLELLIPDFEGKLAALEIVVRSRPDILGHNIETVPRLYCLRPQAHYKRSLSCLEYIKKINKEIYTKSALMLGLSETEKEVLETMEDLRRAGCDFLALGQYLRPSLRQVEVASYIPPEKFLSLKRKGEAMGFKHIEAGAYVRSSYHAAHYIKNS